jgi:hypothetical protein
MRLNWVSSLIANSLVALQDNIHKTTENWVYSRHVAYLGISLHSTCWSIFPMEECCVFCEVRTKSSYLIYKNSSLQNIIQFSSVFVKFKAFITAVFCNNWAYYLLFDLSFSTQTFFPEKQIITIFLHLILQTVWLHTLTLKYCRVMAYLLS